MKPSSTVSRDVQSLAEVAEITIFAEAFFKPGALDTAERGVMTQSEIVRTFIASQEAARLEKTERLCATRPAKARDH